jgi:hypothetical protein
MRILLDEDERKLGQLLFYKLKKMYHRTLPIVEFCYYGGYNMLKNFGTKYIGRLEK